MFQEYLIFRELVLWIKERSPPRIVETVATLWVYSVYKAEKRRHGSLHKIGPHHVPSWWSHLGRVTWRSLIERDVSHGVDLEISKAQES